MQFGEETLRVKLDGGRGRYRKDIFQSSSMLNVSWICDREQYQYLVAFYRTATMRGALPFTIDLIIDDMDLKEYEANFMPGTFTLTSQRGLSYTVSATIEVAQPVNVDEVTDDTAIIDAYEEAHAP